MTITLQDLQAHGACYWGEEGKRRHELAERVEQNLPTTIDDIMEWNWVPFCDRSWVARNFGYTGQIIADDYQEWYLNGKRLTKEEHAKQTKEAAK